MNRRTGKNKVMKSLLITLAMVTLMIFSLFLILSCGAGVDVGGISIYTLTLITDGNGTTDPSGNINVEHGDSTNITATPSDGFQFLNWNIVSGTGVTIEDEEAASTTVTLTDGDATIQANFVITSYMLTVTNDGLGSTDPSGEMAVQHGVPTNITAAASEFFGYSTWFDYWDTGASGVSFGNKNASSTTVTLTDGGATIQARFDQVESDFPSYTVTPDNHAVTIEWPPVALAESYTLYFTTDGSTPSGINGTGVDNVESPEELTEIDNGYLYSFILRANGPAGGEQWSNVEQAIPLSPLTLAPRVRGGYGKNLLEWDALPGQGTNSFVVLRSEERDGTYTNISGMLTDTYTYTDDGDVLSGINYFYKIRPMLTASNNSSATHCRSCPFPDEHASYLNSFPAFSVTNVAISGSYAYVSASGMRIFDVDEESPTYLQQMNYWTSDPAYDIYVEESVAYIATFQGIVIVDVANATDISKLGEFKQYTDLETHNICMKGDYAYIVNDEGSKILDVENPSSISEVGYFNVPYATGVTVAGDYAYFAGSENGMKVIKITNKELPEEVGSCSTVYGWNIAVSGDYAYIADQDEGLKVVDIREPDTLDATYIKGSFTTTDARGIAVSGNYVFLVDNAEGLLVLDVSNPESPKEISTMESFTGPNRVTVSGKYLYIADGTAGLKIIDLLPE